MDRLNDKYFKVIFENVPLGYSITGLDGKLLKVNKAFAELLGYQIEELQGVNIAKITYPDDIEKSFNSIKSLLSNECSNHRFEKKYFHKNGSIIIADVRSLLLRDEKNEALYLLNSIDDITAQKNSEEEKKELIAMLDSAPCLIIAHDAKGKIIYANREAWLEHGYNHDEFMKLNLKDLVSEKDALLFKQRIAGNKEKNELIFEAEHVRKDRSVFPLIVNLTKLRRSDNTDIILSTCTNISERKRIENDLLFQTTILKTQQETSMDGILVVDDNAKVLSFNRKFADMSKLPLDIFSSGYDEIVLKAVSNSMPNPQQFVERIKYLYEHKEEKSREEIVLKDGRTFDRYSAPITSAEGHYYGRVWYFRDITDIKQAEAEKEKRQAQIMQISKLAALSGLSGGMAHEINTPLGVIEGSINIVEAFVEEEKKNPEVMKLKMPLDKIHNSIKKISNIISGLQDLTKPDKMELQEADIHEIIEKALFSFEEQLKNSGIKVIKDFDKNKILFKCHPQKIEQVFLSLIANSKDALEKSEKKEIWIKTYADDNNVTILFADTGHGIDQKIRNRLFEPFFTTKDIGKGTGLGLPVSYSIIRSHKGLLKLDETNEAGARFIITMPLTGI